MLTIPKQYLTIKESALPHAGLGLHVTRTRLEKGTQVWKKRRIFPQADTFDDLGDLIDAECEIGSVATDFSVRCTLLKKMLQTGGSGERLLALYVLWKGYQPNEDDVFLMDGDQALYMNCSDTDFNVMFKRDGQGYLTAPIDSTAEPVELVFHSKNVYVEARFLTEPLRVLVWYNRMFGGNFFHRNRGVIDRPQLHKLVNNRAVVGGIIPRAPFAWLDGARL